MAFDNIVVSCCSCTFLGELLYLRAFCLNHSNFVYYFETYANIKSIEFT